MLVQEKKVLKGLPYIEVVAIKMYKKCPSLNLRSLHMKYDFNHSSGFRDKDVQMCMLQSKMSDLR